MAKEILVSLVNPKEKILLCNVTITFQRVHAAMHGSGSPFVMSQWQ